MAGACDQGGPWPRNNWLSDSICHASILKPRVLPLFRVWGWGVGAGNLLYIKQRSIASFLFFCFRLLARVFTIADWHCRDSKHVYLPSIAFSTRKSRSGVRYVNGYVEWGHSTSDRKIAWQRYRHAHVPFSMSPGQPLTAWCQLYKTL